MSCQKIRSMLSEYIDGEVQSQDAAFIKEHLDTCASCAREFEELRRVTSMLGNTPEVMPPAFLLEKIEAATVNRPTTWESLRELFITPKQIRWAAVCCAVVGALIVMMTSQPGERHIARDTAVKSQPNGMFAPQSVKTSPAEMASAQIASEGRSGKIGVRWHKTAVTKTLAHKMMVRIPKPADRKPKAGVKSPSEPKEADTSDEMILEKDAEEPADGGGADKQAKVDNEETRMAKALAYQETKLKQEVEMLAQIRAQLAARNSKRTYDVQEGRIESRQCSMDLASIRF